MSALLRIPDSKVAALPKWAKSRRRPSPTRWATNTLEPQLRNILEPIALSHHRSAFDPAIAAESNTRPFYQLLVEFRLKNDRFIRAITVRVALRSSLELPLSDNLRRFPLTQETREAWYFNLWLLLLS
jgi:hypothetical protein